MPSAICQIIEVKKSSIVLADGSSDRWQLGFTSPIFGSDRCRGCKTLPEILFGLLQGLQNVPLLQGMKMQGWQNRPRIQGKKMQGMQNLVRGSVCIFARYAMRQTRFSLYICQVCNEANQIQFGFLQGLQ